MYRGAVEEVSPPGHRARCHQADTDGRTFAASRWCSCCCARAAAVDMRPWPGDADVAGDTVTLAGKVTVKQMNSTEVSL